MHEGLPLVAVGLDDCLAYYQTTTSPGLWMTDLRLSKVHTNRNTTTFGEVHVRENI